MTSSGFPNDLLLAYYGDDFTGSTDVMESLTYAGLRTVLFVDPPTDAQLERFQDLRAVGVAGSTRSTLTADMEPILGPVWQRLAQLRPHIVHYKTCSTFDSSVDIGSIGHAIDLALKQFDSAWVPLVVGAPVLQRFCIFGNLFARSGLDSDMFRLDRHPTMMKHPITPMEEADLRIHLQSQTQRRIGLVDVLQIAQGHNALEARVQELLDSGVELVIFDTLTEDHLAAIGRVIWEQAGNPSNGALFTAGSSGLEYALTTYWQRQGWIDPPPPVTWTGVDTVIAVSGSASPVTANQIEYALAHGFLEVPVDTPALADPHRKSKEKERVVSCATELLQDGFSVIVHTARGPQDPRIQATAALLDRSVSGQVLGNALGDILREILRRSGLKRAVTTGGDTSAFVARRIGVQALEVIGPLAPGSPMCRVFGDAAINDLEMTFKGGQVGNLDYFLRVRSGTRSPEQTSN